MDFSIIESDILNAIKTFAKSNTVIGEKSLYRLGHSGFLQLEFQKAFDNSISKHCKNTNNDEMIIIREKAKSLFLDVHYRFLTTDDFLI
jgi:hypothetical protein